MKKIKIATKAMVSSTVVALVLTGMSTVPALAVTADVTAIPTVVTDTELVGSNRIETAIKIAEASWEGAWKGSTHAVIVPKEDSHLIDALAVAPLAYKLEAPILLSDEGDKITKETMDELIKRGVKKVYLATGSGVITDKAKAQLEAQNITVERLGGANRYETAKNIANRLGTTSTVAVVNGQVGLADALSIASIAASEQITIALASDKDTTPTTTDLSGKTVYAIGGNGVLSEKLVSELGAVRLGGSSRYETNVAVINGFKEKIKFDKIYLADGSAEHLVDALTGSVLAAQNGAPIFLTNTQIGVNEQNTLVNTLTGDTAVWTFGGAVDKSVQESVKKVVKDKKDNETVKVEAILVGVDNSLMGTSIVEVKLSATDPENYTVTIKGQAAKYYSVSKSFKIASDVYLEAKDIDVTKDVVVTKKVAQEVVSATLVGVDNSLMGTSIVEIKLSATDAENYDVQIKGQVAKYYSASKSFKIASDVYLETKDIDVAKDVVVTKKVVVSATLVGVDNSLMGASIVAVNLNATDAENYTVTIKGQNAKYYAVDKMFKVALDTYVEAKDIDVTKDVVVMHK